MKTVLRKASELIEDFDLYPRMSVNSAHISELVEVIESKAQLPNIIIDKESRRIIDGFHRRRAFVRLFGEDANIMVEERSYKNKGEMFLDAISLNSGHGEKLTAYDRAHTISKAAELSIDPDLVATALNITTEKYSEITTEKIAHFTMKGVQHDIPLKRSLSHLAGKNMTIERARKLDEIMPKVGGNSLSFYANQLIMQIENGFANLEDNYLMEILGKLHTVLEDVLTEKV